MPQQVPELHVDSSPRLQQKENKSVLDIEIDALKAQLVEQQASGDLQVDTLEDLKWLMIQKERGLHEFSPQASVLDVVTLSGPLDIVSIRLDTQPRTVVRLAKDAVVQKGIRAGEQISFLSEEPVQVELVTVFRGATRIRKAKPIESQKFGKEFVQ